MIENYLLEELVTFAQEKTLDKTAKKLMVTQPTVTRGMQKLEDELGVQLFDRQPNRISLTPTGKLATQEAAKVLAANQALVTKVQNYDQSQHTIQVGSVAPGPLMLIDQKQRLFPNTKLASHFTSPAKVEAALMTNQYSLIINNQDLQTEETESLYVGQEQLYVNLDQFMYLASLQQVSFKDLKGLSFIVLNKIGPWKEQVQKNIPDAKFLYQEEWEALAEISKYSNFPYFSTNLTQHAPLRKGLNADRVTLPIIDKSAKMDFYASYLKRNKAQVKPLINTLRQVWPTK